MRAHVAAWIVPAHLVSEMDLETAKTLAEIVDGQITLLWGASTAIAFAQVMILRTALDGETTMLGTSVLSAGAFLAVLVSFVAGYAASVSRVTLVMEAGSFNGLTGAAADKIIAETKETVEIIEVFMAAQALSLVIAAIAVGSSFVVHRRVFSRIISGGGNGPET